MGNNNAIEVHRGRKNVFTIDLGFDVSADTMTSEIRSEPERSAPLIETFTVTFLTDGTDGKILLTLTEVESGQITEDVGYMDIKRVSGGEALAVFNKPLVVEFRGTVTE